MERLLRLHHWRNGRRAISQLIQRPLHLLNRDLLPLNIRKTVRQDTENDLRLFQAFFAAQRLSQGSKEVDLGADWRLGCTTLPDSAELLLLKLLAIERNVPNPETRRAALGALLLFHEGRIRLIKRLEQDVNKDRVRKVPMTSLGLGRARGGLAREANADLHGHDRLRHFPFHLGEALASAFLSKATPILSIGRIHPPGNSRNLSMPTRAEHVLAGKVAVLPRSVKGAPFLPVAPCKR